MRMNKNALSTMIAAGLLVTSWSTVSQAAGRLVIYCSATNLMCEEEAKAFGEKYDVKTSFIRNGSGSTLAKIEAEKRNPQADVWYGGTLDPHAQAGEMGLLEAYKSPNLSQIMPQFQDPAKIKGNYSSAIYIGVLGFGVNTDRLKQLNLPVPKCWEDLTNPAYKGEIQIADPQSSGTAYTALATFDQLWGEEKAFDYLKKLNANVSQYTKSGIAPARNAARGESAIGIGFLHDYSLEKEKNAPLELIVPCEGTGYEIGGVSIIKGARNMDNAKLFVDWALSKEAQELSWKKGQSYQILTNLEAEASPLALKLSDLKLINYDMDKYGDAETRKTLISKWVSDVKMGK
jgi:iron(III) transport system substrate-binding protein